jgi:hypothetical protein
VAYGYFRKEGERAFRWLRVAPVAGGQPKLDISWAEGAQLHWTAAGDGLLYAKETNGVANIWLQPVGGGPPRQLTSYRSRGIAAYALMPDGKVLLSRATPTLDAVMVTNFR